MQNTGVNTDVAITGNGFFVVQDGSNTYYTRAGDFTQDSNGYLVTADGYRVMGYPAVNGVVNTNGGLTPIQLPMGMTSPPTATSNLSIQANLSAGAAVGDSYSTSVNVYDSLGTAHVLNIDFTNTGSWLELPTPPCPAATSADGAGHHHHRGERHPRLRQQRKPHQHHADCHQHPKSCRWRKHPGNSIGTWRVPAVRASSPRSPEPAATSSTTQNGNCQQAR